MRNRYEKFRIFNGLNESQINLFEEKISIIKHSKNDIIFNEGEKGETLFLLLDGEVEITQALTLELSKANFDTREKSILNLKSDEYPIFGEMSIFGTKENPLKHENKTNNHYSRQTSAIIKKANGTSQ